MKDTLVEDMLQIADKLYEEESYTHAFEKFKFIAENHYCTYSQRCWAICLSMSLELKTI